MLGSHDDDARGHMMMMVESHDVNGRGHMMMMVGVT